MLKNYFNPLKELLRLPVGRLAGVPHRLALLEVACRITATTSRATARAPCSIASGYDWVRCGHLACIWCAPPSDPLMGRMVASPFSLVEIRVFIFKRYSDAFLCFRRLPFQRFKLCCLEKKILYRPSNASLTREKEYRDADWERAWFNCFFPRFFRLYFTMFLHHEVVFICNDRSFALQLALPSPAWNCKYRSDGVHGLRGQDPGSRSDGPEWCVSLYDWC